jgi:hypothetical protein
MGQAAELTPEGCLCPAPGMEILALLSKTGSIMEAT